MSITLRVDYLDIDGKVLFSDRPVDEWGVGSRSSTSPVRISTMSLASWFVARGRYSP